MLSLGQRLKYAREKKNLKQTQVKNKTGIHNKTLSGYENDRAEPDFETLLKLAELYEVDINWIIGKKGKTDDERKEGKLIEIYARLPENKQKIIMDLIESLLQDTKEKNKFE